MKALILVDIQNDFVDGGQLAVKSGLEVVPVAKRLINQFELVVATQDWHPPDHKSFASQHDGIEVFQQFDLNGLSQTAWPDHCVQGSHGAEFVRELDDSLFNHVIQKGTDPEFDSYSGFFDNDKRHDTGLDRYLKDNGVELVYVMGIATDYCVKETAKDAVDCGFETYLVRDGCRGAELCDGDVENAIQEMRAHGVRICVSDDVVHV